EQLPILPTTLGLRHDGNRRFVNRGVSLQSGSPRSCHGWSPHNAQTIHRDEGAPMTTITSTDYSTERMSAEQRKVIFASSLGTVFEWYDFYIYGTLGAFLAKYFFSNVPANVGFIFALLAFAAGFAVRPFGALIFGRIGDMIGRKYTFLVTMTLMGV